MSIVVTLGAIEERFHVLGWTIVASNIVDTAASASITASTIIHYLDALIANPGGVDDQSMPSVSASDATKITNGLKRLGQVAV